MSDEENIDDLIDTSDEVTQDTSEDPTQDVPDDVTPSDDDPTQTPEPEPEPEPQPEPNVYCSKEDVNSMFGDISDEVTDAMFNTAIGNATTWIEANLKRNYVPIPTEHVGALQTVAIYHSASDILLTLYHGDDLPIQYDVWFNKAQTLLDDYIEAYLKSEAEEEDLLTHQMVGHSHSRTYNQKRGRQTWAR